MVTTCLRYSGLTGLLLHTFTSVSRPLGSLQASGSFSLPGLLKRHDHRERHLGFRQNQQHITRLRQFKCLSQSHGRVRLCKEARRIKAGFDQPPLPLVPCRIRLSWQILRGPSRTGPAPTNTHRGR